MTLKRLAVWVSEPMLRLKTLASLTDALETLPAGKLIAALDAAAQHGNPSVSATVSGPAPLLPSPVACWNPARYSSCWMTNLELEDRVSVQPRVAHEVTAEHDSALSRHFTHKTQNGRETLIMHTSSDFLL